MVPTFAELLTRAGAEEPRQQARGRWRCPHCPPEKVPALSVDVTKEVFFCHRCNWKGGRRTLEKQLGIIPQRRTITEIRHRDAVRDRAARFERWWRGRLDFFQAVIWTLNDIERHCRAIGEQCLADGEVTPEWVFSDLAFVVENRPHFEDQHRLFSDPERNIETLWERYRQDLRLAA